MWWPGWRFQGRTVNGAAITELYQLTIFRVLKKSSLAANAGGRGFESHRGQKFIFHILLS